MKTLSKNVTSSTKSKPGRSIAQNLKITDQMTKRAAAHDRVISGGAK